MYLPLNQLIQYKEETALFDESTLEYVKYNYVSRFHEIIQNNLDNLNIWQEDGKARWSTRFRKLYYKKYKENPDQDQVNKLSRWVQTFTGQDGIFFDIQKRIDPNGWKFPYDTRAQGCWCDGRRQPTKDKFFKHPGGYAVRFFESYAQYVTTYNKGIGRMWLFVDGDLAVEFNHRGKLNTGAMVQAFAGALGLKHKKLKKLNIKGDGSIHTYIDTHHSSYGFSENIEDIPDEYVLPFAVEVTL